MKTIHAFLQPTGLNYGQISLKYILAQQEKPNYKTFQYKLIHRLIGDMDLVEYPRCKSCHENDDSYQTLPFICSKPNKC